MFNRGPKDVFRTVFVGVLCVVIALGFIIFLRKFIIPPPLPPGFENLACKNNLKEYEKALLLYRNDWGQQYPPYSGVKFLAVLYRGGYITNKKYFLCPAREDAEWNESTDPAMRTDVKFQRPAPGEAYTWPWEPADLLKPWEITYAGRRNDPADEGGKFCLTQEGGDPTPIVSDSTLDHEGRNAAENGPHGKDGGEINVLLTDGSIVTLKGVTVGVHDSSVPMDLECLSNK